MSENTNTPNGDSKDLYSIHEDVGKEEVAVIDMSQKNPAKELTGVEPGDNTVTEVSDIIDNTVAIRDFGEVKIKLGKVGEPKKTQEDGRVSPEDKAAIREEVEKLKEKYKSRGIIFSEEYIQLKKEKENEKNREPKDDERNQK